MDFGKIIWTLKERWEKLNKNFQNKVNYLTFFDYVKNAKYIWLIGHDKIDWDSLWSILAMQRWIKSKFQEKKVKSYTNRKPSSVFDFLDYDINYWEKLIIDDDIDLLIIMDCADLQRIWQLYDNNKDKITKTSIINIDHHITNPCYWEINIVDWQSPATAQIVYDIISFLENRLNNIINNSENCFDDKIATYLLMWILTDTLSFTTSLTKSKTLKIASKLMEKWADKDLIITNIFLSKNINEIKLYWLIIDRIEKININWITTYFSYFSEEDLILYQLDVDDIWADNWVWRSTVNIMKQIDDADFVSLWKIKADKTTVSFRSKKFDVSKLALKLWWWWHPNAAWAKIDTVLTVDEIRKTINDLIS